MIFQGRLTMTTGEDAAERLEKRAVEAEETIAALNSQLLFLKKAAGRIMLWRFILLVWCQRISTDLILNAEYPATDLHVSE